ncbi:hypothetical protein V2J09_011739 [Rumex salicifolius]
MYSDPDDTNGSDVEGSLTMISPWNKNSPTIYTSPAPPFSGTAVVASLVLEDGHVYSLATKPGGLLYTGSDSKNIRVWKSLKYYSGFRSGSGLVKAIIISNDKIFTGHQDGKIRVWKVSGKDPSVHRRYGSLPTLKDVVKSSLNPNSYVTEAKKPRRRFVWNKHWDAVSCLSLAEEQGLLYSSSWDRTFKVWRVSDSRCVESVVAHDDAVNSVAAKGGVVFTGSADGTVKVWRREATRHSLLRTMLRQDYAVNAVAVGPTAVYCGSSDGLVRFWERSRLEYGGAVRGHETAVLCLAATGRMVFSGSADKCISVWRREKGMVHVRVAVLSGHMGPVKCLAVEEEAEEKGRWRLYSGSLDKSVKVWTVSE